ncbi:Aste57867_12440 [Aphanomyces stellatus]|uniref:Aste57867_12440 protein n=1 Tax=Aphanomyces stellatus TaxID=120398 RepID=A0A485KXJ3_9STRA|nr:hypothetical protein As57867_012394 [Aphanomyces stellatus]VFT89291.1 Aste57867_12440 [Aphanomyces stellatus]
MASGAAAALDALVGRLARQICVKDTPSWEELHEHLGMLLRTPLHLRATLRQAAWCTHSSVFTGVAAAVAKGLVDLADTDDALHQVFLALTDKLMQPCKDSRGHILKACKWTGVIGPTQRCAKLWDALLPALQTFLVRGPSLMKTLLPSVDLRSLAASHMQCTLPAVHHLLHLVVHATTDADAHALVFYVVDVILALDWTDDAITFRDELLARVFSFLTNLPFQTHSSNTSLAAIRAALVRHAKAAHEGTTLLAQLTSTVSHEFALDLCSDLYDQWTASSVDESTLPSSSLPSSSLPSSFPSSSLKVSLASSPKPSSSSWEESTLPLSSLSLVSLASSPDLSTATRWTPSSSSSLDTLVSFQNGHFVLLVGFCAHTTYVDAAALDGLLVDLLDRSKLSIDRMFAALYVASHRHLALPSHALMEHDPLLGRLPPPLVEHALAMTLPSHEVHRRMHAIGFNDAMSVVPSIPFAAQPVHIRALDVVRFHRVPRLPSMQRPWTPGLPPATVPVNQHLHMDVLQHVFSFLSDKRLCRLASVCRVFHTAAQDPFLWQQLYAKFGTVCTHPPTVEHEWRAMYKARTIKMRRGRRPKGKGRILTLMCDRCGCNHLSATAVQQEKHTARHLHQETTSKNTKKRVRSSG